MKTHVEIYIEKELRDGSIDIEYDGYLKNLHPTKTLYVQIKIITNTDQAKFETITLPPLSEKMVMSHNAGPVLENEFDFEILKVYARKPS